MELFLFYMKKNRYNHFDIKLFYAIYRRITLRYCHDDPRTEREYFASYTDGVNSLFEHFKMNYK